MTQTRVVYLDNNATTKPCVEAVNAAVQVATDVYGNPSSSHQPGKRANLVLERSRDLIGHLLGIQNPSQQLFFTSGATESNNIVIRGRVAHTTPQKKCHVVTTNVEHASVYVTLKDMEKHGVCKLTIVKVDKEGFVRAKDIEKAIKPGETTLVTVIVGHNEIGTIQNTRQIVNVCRKHKGVHCHFDLTQMVGRYPLNFSKMGMDSASFSGHKFHGLRGVGGLYLLDKTSIETVITGGVQENNVRAGTENLAGVVSTAVALQECSNNLVAKMRSTKAKRDWIQNKLLRYFPGEVKVNGPKNVQRLYNTLSISQSRVKGKDLLQSLSDLGVCVSVGSACSKSAGSKTLQALHLPKHLQEGTLRVSLSHYTTWEDCEKAVGAIVNCLEQKGSSKRHNAALKSGVRRLTRK